MALAIFMQLSLTKAAHAAVSNAAWQEIRVRSVEKHLHEGPRNRRSLGCARDDKGRVDNKGRVAARLAIGLGVERRRSLGFARDDKGEGGFSLGIGCRDPRSQKRDLGHPSIVSDTDKSPTEAHPYKAT